MRRLLVSCITVLIAGQVWADCPDILRQAIEQVITP